MFDTPKLPSTGTPLDALAEQAYELQVAQVEKAYQEGFAKLKAKKARRIVLPRYSYGQLVARFGQAAVAQLTLICGRVSMIYPAHFAN